MTEIDELFEGGPLMRGQRWLGLVRPGERRLARRCVLAVAIGWAPLALVNGFQAFVMGDEAAKTFFSDVAVHARFLIAVPLLVIAEADCIPLLRHIAHHFLAAGLITEQDRERYSAAVASSQRLLTSATAEIIIVALAYGAVVAMIYCVPPAQIPVWHRAGAGFHYFSLDGWWHALVSIPLLIILFLGWAWRVLLWARLLWLIARLDLRLIPSHPDRVGGLLFVSTSLRGFRLLGCALGTIAAGVVANRVLLEDASPLQFKYLPIGMVILVIACSSGPLTVFTSKLRKANAQAMFTYGPLAAELGEYFERKWGGAKNLVGGLEGRDFSSTSGFFRVVENVYEMDELPLRLKDMTDLLFATLLPFVPLALMVVPIEDVLQKLVKLVL